MPSPFPGMDPYLEGNEWMSFHAQFCTEIARQLAPQLRPRYVALTMRRFVTDTPEDLAITTKSANIYPDIGVAGRTPVPFPIGGARAAVLEPTLQIATVMPELISQYMIEIQNVEERQLVTLIEVLSPADKRGEGYREYVERRTRILVSTSHLLEINLLRNGTRAPMRRELPESPYFVFLSRWQRCPITDIWEISLEQPLPTVPVPLLPGDKDVALNLQAAFTTAYDSVGYDLVLDYTRPRYTP